MDIGKNYFKNINPRKKKTLITLLDSYISNLKEQDLQTFSIGLEIYFDNKIDGTNIDNIQGKQLDLDESVLWHLYSLMVFDRIGNHIARFEYLEQYQIIKAFN